MELLIILIILILILFIWNQSYESFEDFEGDILGAEGQVPPEYSDLNYKTINMPMQNYRDFAGLNWDYRFPYMVKQKYSYTDFPKCNCDRAFHDYAVLKELPLELDPRLPPSIPCGCQKCKYNPFPIDCTYALSTNSLNRLGGLNGYNENRGEPYLRV